MSRLSRALVLILLLAPRVSPAVQQFSGATEGGAFYTLEAPDDWQPADGLVIYNHGFDIGPVDTEPGLGVLSNYLRGQGFAVAASSYRLNGWALFATADDNRALYGRVVEHLGVPERVFVFGGSLGALVTVQAVEQGGIGNVVGAYPVCGPLLGSDVWHQALDLRLAYDVVCEGVTGGRLPGGPAGLPYTLDPDQFDGILGEVTAAAIGAAVGACTGLGLPDGLRSSNQRERMARLLDFAGIDEGFLGVNMAYATAVLSDLVRDERKLDGRHALGNAGVVYDDPDIDARILRVDRDPLDHVFLKRAYTPTGRVGDTRVLITHTDKDDLVFVEHLQAYAEKAPADRLTTAVVVEDQPGHCAYTEAEIVAGWEQLLEWVEGGEQPSASSIQDHCLTLLDQGGHAGPCRYDPGFDLDGRPSRFRARGEPERPVDAGTSGAFYVADKSGQGWFVEVLEGGRAVIYWFTFDAEGRPLWIGGTGEVLDHALIIDESWTASGPRFGEAFDASDLQLQPWGELTFAFTGETTGEMAYSGPAGFGADREFVDQLIRLGHCPDDGMALSGLWYDPARNGEGIILQQQSDGRLFAAWFTYDTEGAPLWFFGEAQGMGEGRREIALSRFSGPRFGPGYDSAALLGEAWGVIQVESEDGASLSVDYQSLDAGFGSGHLDLLRLTRPRVSERCGAPF